MKIETFCSWGVGAKDVGINITRTEEECAGWATPHLNIFVDLTADEAEKLADELRAHAVRARALDHKYERHVFLDDESDETSK